jgi:hypothetical protein
LENTHFDLIYSITDFSEKVTLLFGSPESPYIVVVSEKESSQENLQQLEAILKAIQIDLHSQVQLIQIKEKQKIRVREMNQKAGYLFLFGVTPDTVGITFPCISYQFYKANNMYLVFSEGLSVIKAQTESKRRLWACLKSFFIDKVMP